MKKLVLITAAVVACTMIASCTEPANTGVYTDVPEYSLGTLAANGYVSGWSGIEFIAENGVVMASDDDYADIDSVGDGAVYEMMALCGDNNDSVLIRVVTPDGVSFEEYVTIENRMVAAEYTKVGFTVTEKTLDDASFGGRMYKGSLFTLSLGTGTSIYQCVYRAMLGDQICEIIFSYYDEANFDVMKGCFN